MSVEAPIPSPAAPPTAGAGAAHATPSDTRRACPSCGAMLKPHSQRCHLCYTWLGWGPPPRHVAKYQLISTDFMAAERQNRRNTALLIAIVLLVGLLVGWLLGWLMEMLAREEVPTALLTPGSGAGALFFVVVGLVCTMVTLSAGRWMVLHLTGAGEVTPEQEPVLHNVVEEMAIAAGLPKPKVAVVESPALNAFATGMRSDRAAIAVTRGLLNALTRDELQGVVAHEMSHIRNLDTRYLTTVAIMVGLIALLADFGTRVLIRAPFRTRRSGSKGGNPLVIVILIVGVICLVLAPLFARLVQFAVSRQREFLADATSVRLTRNPLGLISALEKLHQSTVPLESANRAVQHMFIVNPWRDFAETDSALMATHPPIARRIERLRNLAGAVVPDGQREPGSEPPRGSAAGS